MFLLERYYGKTFAGKFKRCRRRLYDIADELRSEEPCRSCLCVAGSCLSVMSVSSVGELGTFLDSDGVGSHDKNSKNPEQVLVRRFK